MFLGDNDFYLFTLLLFYPSSGYYRFVLRYEGLHDDPSDEVSHGTEAEHDHVSRRFALITQEGEC